MKWRPPVGVVPVVLALMAAVVLSSTGCTVPQARFQRQATSVVSLTGPAPLAVKAENGSVKIEPTTDGQFQVRATIRASTQERADAVIIRVRTLDDGTLAVEAVWPTPRKGGEGVSFEVMAPPVQGVRVTTTNGSVTVMEMAGPVHIRTSNGAITAARCSGDTDLSTSNGSVDCTLADGASPKVRITTSNGSVKFRCGKGFTGMIDAQSSNGVVRPIVTGPATVTTIKTNHVKVQVGEASAPTAAISTSNGDVELEVRP